MAQRAVGPSCVKVVGHGGHRTHCPSPANQRSENHRRGRAVDVGARHPPAACAARAALLAARSFASQGGAALVDQVTGRAKRRSSSAAKRRAARCQRALAAVGIIGQPTTRVARAQCRATSRSMAAQSGPAAPLTIAAGRGAAARSACRRRRRRYVGVRSRRRGWSAARHARRGRGSRMAGLGAEAARPRRRATARRRPSAARRAARTPRFASTGTDSQELSCISRSSWPASQPA